MSQKSIDQLYCMGHLNPILSKCKSCTVNKHNSECRFFYPITDLPQNSESWIASQTSSYGGDYDRKPRPPKPDEPKPPRPQTPSYMYFANMQLMEEEWDV